MDVVEELIADWIRIRTTLKGQLKHFEDGNHIVVPGHETAEARDRVHRCVTEIELLIAHYSSKA